MVSRKPIVVWAAQTVAGLALLAHALHGGFGLGGDDPAPIFDQWIYDGLMLTAATICLARAIWWRP